ncbi:MAG: LuxR C-terminal-related transcriptional regulator [Pseudomonadota bacterium]
MQWLHKSRRKINGTALVTAMESLDQVSASADLIAWTQTDFQSAFPHGAFVACLGKVLDTGVKPIAVLPTNFSTTSLDVAHRANGRYDTFLMEHWLQSGEPQLFDLSRDADALHPGYLKAFKANGLQNIAAHGLLDVTRDHASFFSFLQLPYPPREEQARVLKLIIPALHAALLRCVRSHTVPPTGDATRPALTNRETEVLKWICLGKTNSEIASILNSSPHTVKNQTRTILVKMRVNSRAQAAAEAMRHRLVPRY